jgi:DNA adenine methylase
MKLLPVIKWTGSKRALADEIVEYFPKQIDTYYEPFCGGCSVLFNILHKDISIKNFVCSDLNADLIAFFNELKTNPTNVSSEYARRWETLNSFSEIQDRKKYYESVRADYNKNHGVYDFIFLTRTCFNGLIRYNRNGEFNSPFHLNRPGINPDTFNSILFDWSSKIKNVEFVCQSYDSIKPNKGDFVFMDPPYANTNSIYFGGIDLNQLWKWIE